MLDHFWSLFTHLKPLASTPRRCSQSQKNLEKLGYFQHFPNAEDAISNACLPQAAPLGACSAGPVSWTTFCLGATQRRYNGVIGVITCATTPL